ncbi:hypothetical protein GCM10027155_01380 [Acinetobacter apis]
MQIAKVNIKRDTKYEIVSALYFSVTKNIKFLSKKSTIKLHAFVNNNSFVTDYSKIKYLDQSAITHSLCR